jgi:uncharacterized protein (UPF0332 family)/predicted nucleotidyltransferase
VPLAPDLHRALVDGLRALYGERLRRVVLFGSEARDDARPDSDVDVLVVLDGEVDGWAESWNVSDLSVEILRRFHRLVEFVVMDEATFLHGDWPLLTNVREEGTALFESTSASPPLRRRQRERRLPIRDRTAMKESTRAILGKARTSLAAARRDLAAADAENAAARAYYAAFHAATAALHERGRAARSHKGTPVLFHELFVREGAFDPHLARVLAALFERRQAADYGSGAPITLPEAESGAREAEAFVAAVEAWLAAQPDGA